MGMTSPSFDGFTGYSGKTVIVNNIPGQLSTAYKLMGMSLGRRRAGTGAGTRLGTRIVGRLRPTSAFVIMVAITHSLYPPLVAEYTT